MGKRPPILTYSGRERKLPVSILIEPSKKGNRKEGWKGDKGFVRNRDRSLSTFRDVDVWFFQPVVVRDSKVTSGTIILPRIPKFTAILIKVSTLRGWNGGGPDWFPFSSPRRRPCAGNIDPRRAVFCYRDRDAIGRRLRSFRPTKIER